MKRQIHQNGYSLVETLIAVAILMLAIVGPMTIAAKSIQSAQYSLQQNTAFFLAQEGISMINTIRNDSLLEYLHGDRNDPWRWARQNNNPLSACFRANERGCNIDYSTDVLLDNVVSCNNGNNCQMHYTTDFVRSPYNNIGQGVASPYTRTIVLERIDHNGDDDEVKVEVTVEWESALLGQARSVTLTTHLFNFYKE